MRDLFPQGVQSVVDAVGVNALLNEAMGLIADHGKICSYGISPKLEMNLSWAPAPYNWSLTFVQFPEKKEEAAQHEEVMEMIRTGECLPRDFISLVLPQGEIATAFDLVEQKNTDPKTVIEFRASAHGKERIRMQQSKLFQILPDYICTPDGMAIDREGNLVLSCPNFADDSLPGCVVKIDKQGSVRKWFDVPVNPATALRAPWASPLTTTGTSTSATTPAGSAGRRRTSPAACSRSPRTRTASANGKTVACGMEHPNGVRIRDGLSLRHPEQPHKGPGP